MVDPIWTAGFSLNPTCVCKSALLKMCDVDYELNYTKIIIIVTSHIHSDSDVIFFIPHLCQLFFCRDVRQALRSVCYCDITFLVRYSDNTDIFLNHFIQFYSNNATNLHLTALLMRRFKHFGCHCHLVAYLAVFERILPIPITSFEFLSQLLCSMERVVMLLKWPHQESESQQCTDSDIALPFKVTDYWQHAEIPSRIDKIQEECCLNILIISWKS